MNHIGRNYYFATAKNLQGFDTFCGRIRRTIQEICHRAHRMYKMPNFDRIQGGFQKCR